MVLPGMLVGGGLLAVPPLPGAPPVAPPVLPPELLETPVPGVPAALPESVVLLEPPPPQAVRVAAAARIGNPIVHDPFFKAELPERRD